MTTTGSNIAKNGFRNEDEIIGKFNDWAKDEDAQAWLVKMGYDLGKIEYVKAEKIKGTYKSDINVLVQVKLRKLLNAENIQVKLVSNKKGFNQTDKRWVSTYREMWHIPARVFELLEYFTGSKPPYRKDIRDEEKRRMFITGFEDEDQKLLVSWFQKNLILVVTDVIKGRGQFCAEWILVAQKTDRDARWVLININEAIQHYFGDGRVSVTKQGSLRLGNVTLQRKGGDGGKESANMLQFKVDPTELFEMESH